MSVPLDFRVLLPALLTVAALVAAALIAFSALGGSVGVSDLPESAGSDGPGGIVVLGEGPISGNDERETRARAAGDGGTGAPSPRAARTESAGSSDSEAGAAMATAPGDVPAAAGSQPPGESPGAGAQPADPGSPAAPAPEVPAAPVVPATSEEKSEAGLITGSVSAVDETVSGLTGIDPGLADATAPVEAALGGLAGG